MYVLITHQSAHLSKLNSQDFFPGEITIYVQVTHGLFGFSLTSVLIPVSQ